MKVTVIGSGAWGTALAILLHTNGHRVTLWSHRAEKAQEMTLTRENALLPDARLPEEINITSELSCLQEAEMAVFVTPSYALRDTAHAAAKFLPKKILLVSATKGIELETHFRMSQVIEAETGLTPVVLSGPSHAEEVSRGIPTGCVAACADRTAAKAVQKAFMNENFRIYTHDDAAGVELCGAFKNVTALSCGISDGYGMGDNTKALLMTRAMAELSRLVECLGGRLETVAGLAGMGDLIVTCTSMHSRNRRFGILIGQGMSSEDALQEIGAVVEGYYAAKSALELAKDLKIELPICRAAYEVLYHGADVGKAIRTLMRRPPRRETDSNWVQN